MCQQSKDFLIRLIFVERFRYNKRILQSTNSPRTSPRSKPPSMVALNDYPSPERDNMTRVEFANSSYPAVSSPPKGPSSIDIRANLLAAAQRARETTAMAGQALRSRLSTLTTQMEKTSASVENPGVVEQWMYQNIQPVWGPRPKRNGLGL